MYHHGETTKSISILLVCYTLNILIFGVHRTTNTEMHVVLFNTIDVYTAIMFYWLSGTWVAQWYRTREYCTLIFLSSALLVRILHATFIFKDFFFLFNILLLQNCFSILINLISLVTITFTRRIRNTVLQLSPVASSVFKIHV